MLHIPNISLNTTFHLRQFFRFTTKAMGLCPTCYTRFDKMTHHIFINQSRISLCMSQHMWARSNYRHFTFKDINKLGKFIYVRTSKEISKFSLSGIIGCCLLFVCFIIHSHRTETYSI